MIGENMKKEWLKDFVNEGLQIGADFVDVFFETKSIQKYIFLNRKLDRIAYELEKGIGVRLNRDEESYYIYENELEKNKIIDMIDSMKSNFHKKENPDVVEFKPEQVHELQIKVPHSEYGEENKKALLKKIDSMIRKIDSRIDQVTAILYEYDQNVWIANSFGNMIEDNRILTRLSVTVSAKDGEKNASLSRSFGKSIGYELLEEIDLEKELKDLTLAVLRQLDAAMCPGGEMPVVIGPGFGGVIFHEACGHALEATLVADQISVLSGKKGKQIASPVVTLIDDGTIEGAWGSTVFDDEGNRTQKNILIEDGILKNYLVDYGNSVKMKQEITGSGRRESYKYAVTSRMNNTYLKPGKDTLDNMIRSILYGLYAKSMSGGSVIPNTGDFNFTVEEGYMIRDGKVAEPVKGASLIGNTSEILKQIEMVGNDFDLGAGFCGSQSGMVPVCVGEPSIKVSKILVGGGKNDETID